MIYKEAKRMKKLLVLCLILVLCLVSCDEGGYSNDILRNQTGCEWLNEVSAEDIAEI